MSTLYSKEKTIIELFVQQVRKTPDEIAIIVGADTITYQNLDAKSNQLANYLQKRGVKEETLIPICTSSSIKMIIGLLGIMKAGGAYVPIDSQYPIERIEYVLADIDSNLLIIDKTTSMLLSKRQAAIEVVNIDSGWKVIEEESTEATQTNFCLQNLAYVIYTSGSTGVPKGVLIEHKSISNYIVNSINAYSSKEQNVGSYVHLPLSFDASLTAIFTPLLIGKKIIINSLTPLDAFNNDSLLHHGSLDFLKITPAQLYLINTASEKQVRNVSKKYVIGGEALQQQHYKFLVDDQVDVEIINEYGPTEATVGCITYKFHVSDNIPIYPHGVLIGTPMPGVNVYILDRSLNPVPAGLEGEIYIGGVQVARGYLNRYELTKEKFLPDPFASNNDARMYKSGDLARQLPDGNLEYLGRIDEQVKIRGYRIELGEIEHVLHQYPNVKYCAVAAKEDLDGNKRLIAYLVMERDYDKKAVINFLKSKLPEYMVPQLLMKLENIPLTRNGKVDKKLLPNPDASSLLSSSSVLPNTKLEKTLTDLWKTVLNVEKTGIQDNFFELGGNSLLALKMITNLKKQFNYDVPITKLYQFPTINELVHYLQGTKANAIKYKKKFLSQGSNRDVAVIGMAGRFPGANTVEMLWEVLKQERETIRFFSSEELDSSISESKRNDLTYIKAKGIIENADQFDASFFNLAPRLAELMDPQQRIFLEIAWEVLEQTGYLPNRYDGDIGVYAGSGYNTYFLHNVLPNKWLIDQTGIFQLMTLNEKDYIASRVAYQLNLKGPAVSVHSACSTSLLAIAQAVDSIRNGHCEIALAGGSSITSPINSGHTYQEGSILSSDGHCRSFDAEAKGTVFSDGAGVVLLKNLEAAKRDGDVIYAVIKGIGVNNDGSSKGSFTAPNAEGQSGAIALALEDGQVDSSTISYIEAHGTATPLGDPIEVEGLTMAFGDQLAKQFCAIGSIKSNIGHLTAAAGVAGFIKTTLALYNKQIPASLYYSKPNPNIDFVNSPFFVNTKLIDWQSPGLRRAGVSSFGIGGTNVHIVLEEFDNQLATHDLENFTPNRPVQLITWSAKSVFSCNAYAQVLANHLKQKSELDLADVAFTLQTTRTAFDHRRFAVVGSNAELSDTLRTASESLLEVSTEVSSKTKFVQNNPDHVVFLFPGQGVQYLNMGRELYENERIYRQAVDECAELLKEHLETDIRQIIYPKTIGPEAEEHLKNPCYAQPALFLTEYAIAKLWMSWGIQPSILCGQSIGEFVAAHLAGIFTLADALKLMAIRGRMVSKISGGSMLSVRFEAEKIQAMLPENVSIAVINSPKLCVVSGPDKAITDFSKVLDEKEITNRLLLVNYASHSSMMNPVVKDFQKVVESVTLMTPQKPIISTVTGIPLTNNQATNPVYWAEHLRKTVRFSDALESIFKLSKPLLLEVGPGNTTAIIARQQVDVSQVTVLASLETYNNSQTDYRSILKTLGQLWINGLEPNWNEFYAGQHRNKVKLPTYVFDRKRCWIDPIQDIIPITFTSSQNSQPDPTAETHSLSNQIIKRQDVLTGRVRKILTDASGIKMENMEPNTTFLEAGLDSLLLTQLSLTLKKVFDLPISFRQLNEECATLDKLVAYLNKNLPIEVHQLQTAPVIQAKYQPEFPSQQPAMLSSDVDSVLERISQQLQKISQEVVLLRESNLTLPSLTEKGPLATMDSEPISLKTAPLASEVNIEKSFDTSDYRERQGSELALEQNIFLKQLISRYIQKTKGSKDYYQKWSKVYRPEIPPQAPLIKEVNYPIVVNRSKGCRLWDMDGNEYIDVMNGAGLNMLAYQGEISKHGRGINPQTNLLAQEINQMICEFTGNDWVALCSTSTQAIQGAIQIARTVTGRSLIIAFEDSFFTSQIDIRSETRQRGSSVIFKEDPNFLLLDYDADTSLKIIQERANELAAILIKPTKSGQPEFDFIRFLMQIRTITADLGAALIFDELITGIRMHPNGAQTLSGIKADLILYKKSADGELPVSIVTGKNAFMASAEDSFGPQKHTSTLFIGNPYFVDDTINNPLALMITKRSLQYMKKINSAIQKNLNTKAKKIAETVNAELERQQLPLFIDQFGPLWKIKFSEEIPYGELLFTVMREKDIHILPDFPCSITEYHTPDDIQKIIDSLLESINILVEAGFFRKQSKAIAAVKNDSVQYFLNKPPTPEAKLGRDRAGNPAWFISNPGQRDKYLQI